MNAKSDSDRELLMYAHGGPPPPQADFKEADELLLADFNEEITGLESSLATPVTEELTDRLVKAAYQVDPDIEGLMNQELEQSNAAFEEALKQHDAGAWEPPEMEEYESEVHTGSLRVTRAAPYDYVLNHRGPENRATQAGGDPNKGTLYSSAVMGGNLGKGVASSLCGLGFYVKPLVKKCRFAAYTFVGFESRAQTQTWFSEAHAHSRITIHLEKFRKDSRRKVESVSGDVVSVTDVQRWWPSKHVESNSRRFRFMEVGALANPGDWFRVWLTQITYARANGGSKSWALSSMSARIPYFRWAIY